MAIDPVPGIHNLRSSTNENQEKCSVERWGDRSGRTAFARACNQDVAEAKKWLEARPQDIDIPDYAGNTPLQIAALNGDIGIVQLLLNAGCEITSKNIDHDTPLIDAVENRHLGVVRLLLAAGMDPEGKNAKGQKLLELIPFDDGEAGNIKAALLVAKNVRDARRKAENRMLCCGRRTASNASAGYTMTMVTRCTAIYATHGSILNVTIPTDMAKRSQRRNSILSITFVQIARRGLLYIATIGRRNYTLDDQKVKEGPDSIHRHC